MATSKQNKSESQVNADVKSSTNAGPTPAAVDSKSDSGARRHSDSADIAVERPSLSYPMPKKSEGKILRPQYKDILQGTWASLTFVPLLSVSHKQGSTLTITLFRPRQRPTLD